MSELVPCEHKYEDMDWEKMICSACGKTMLEIVSEERYGPNWRVAVGKDWAHD